MSCDDDLGLAPSNLASRRLAAARQELGHRIRAVARRGPAPTVLALPHDDVDQADESPAGTAATFAELVNRQLRRGRP